MDVDYRDQKKIEEVTRLKIVYYNISKVDVNFKVVKEGGEEAVFILFEDNTAIFKIVSETTNIKVPSLLEKIRKIQSKKFKKYEH